MKVWQIFKEYAWLLCILLSVACFYFYNKPPEIIYKSAVNIDNGELTVKDIKRPQITLDSSIKEQAKVQVIEKKDETEADLNIKDNYKFKANIMVKRLKLFLILKRILSLKKMLLI